MIFLRLDGKKLCKKAILYYEFNKGLLQLTNKKALHHQKKVCLTKKRKKSIVAASILIILGVKYTHEITPA
ncbi:MAG: hypothetical protein OEY01_04205 [Desulfobulbaceae bacterium]|nr:hypothetical protein [Desulfobulbaceae bacterium]